MGLFDNYSARKAERDFLVEESRQKLHEERMKYSDKKYEHESLVKQFKGAKLIKNTFIEDILPIVTKELNYKKHSIKKGYVSVNYKFSNESFLVNFNISRNKKDFFVVDIKEADYGESDLDDIYYATGALKDDYSLDLAKLPSDIEGLKKAIVSCNQTWGELQKNNIVVKIYHEYCSDNDPTSINSFVRYLSTVSSKDFIYGRKEKPLDVLKKLYLAENKHFKAIMKKGIKEYSKITNLKDSILFNATFIHSDYSNLTENQLDTITHIMASGLVCKPDLQEFIKTKVTSVSPDFYIKADKLVARILKLKSKTFESDLTALGELGKGLQYYAIAKLINKGGEDFKVKFIASDSADGFVKEISYVRGLCKTKHLTN